MITYFHEYVHSNTMLNVFVVYYAKTIHARPEAKEKENFPTMKTLATLSGTHPIEKVSGDRHPRNIFKKFQAFIILFFWWFVIDV